MTPSMAAGMTDKLYDMKWIVSQICARAPKPKRPTSYRPRG